MPKRPTAQSLLLNQSAGSRWTLVIWIRDSLGGEGPELVGQLVGAGLNAGFKPQPAWSLHPVAPILKANGVRW
jgi:hypothetical protein